MNYVIVAIFTRFFRFSFSLLTNANRRRDGRNEEKKNQNSNKEEVKGVHKNDRYVTSNFYGAPVTWQVEKHGEDGWETGASNAEIINVRCIDEEERLQLLGDPSENEHFTIFAFHTDK